MMCARCAKLEARLEDWRTKMDTIHMHLMTNLKKAREFNQDFELTSYEMLTIAARVETYVENCPIRKPRSRPMVFKPTPVRVRPGDTLRVCVKGVDLPPHTQ